MLDSPAAPAARRRRPHRPEHPGHPGGSPPIQDALQEFAEYFHNGHGVGRLGGEALPANLRERLSRGEVFNLMRDYLALGASFRWHHLVSQSAALIANLRDGSAALQASLTVDASDATRLQAGIALPFGDVGEEFGGIALGRQTAGGAKQMFLRAVYYF